MPDDQDTTSRPTRHLMYFADPMCSWCWGFAPAIDQILEEFAGVLPLRTVMGGLRPGHEQPMNDNDKRQKQGNWEQVHAASGQPFNFDFFDRDGFIDNTEPACRAVVAARRMKPENAIRMMRSIQWAFHTQNCDVTQVEELCRLAADTGFDVDEFRSNFDDIDTMDETRNDFWLAQNSGVGSFPTLVAFVGRRAQAVTIGYRPWQEIGPALKAWLESDPSTT